MKVLFAFNNEKGVNQIAEFYKDHYGEKLEVTKVFFFRSLIDTLKKNKNFDRIVIHEDLEPTGSKNQDAIDKYLFNNLDKVTDEAGRADIIVVCTERRKQNDKFVKTLFNLGIYNILTGPDRTVGKVTELINRPRTKKEAKLFVDVDLEENPYEAIDKIDELEIRNIIKYFEQNIFSKEKIVSGFDSLYEQYTFENLKQEIVPVLPIKAREVLERESEKYIALMNYKPSKGGRHEQVRVVEVPVYIQQEPVKKEEPKEEKPKKAPVVEEIKQEAIKEPESKVKYTPPPTTVEKEREISLRRENKVEGPQSGPITEVETSNNVDVITTLAAPVAGVIEKVMEDKVEETKVEKKVPDVPKVEVEIKKKEEPKVEPVVKEPEIVVPKIDLEVKRDDETKKVETEVNTEEIVVPKIDLEAKRESEPKVETPVVKEPEIVLPKIELEKPKQPKVEMEEKKPEPPKVEPVVEKVQPVVTPKVEVEPVKPEPPKVEPQVETSRPSYTPPKYQPPRPTTIDNRIQTVTQVIEKEVIKSVNELPKDYKKVVCFVGAHKAGTTFMVNAAANLLISKGIKVAILDLTYNKDLYMIYTNRDIEQREVAGNSLNNLGIGQNKPFVLGNLSLYTGLPRTNKNKLDIYKAIEIAKKDNSVVLIDCDFTTKKDLPDVFRYVQNIYVVQDMDTLNILPMTMFLKELKNSDVDNSKISVIINKYIKSVLKIDDILGALMNYTSPDLSVMEEGLLPKSVRRFVVPFDQQNYLRYIENIYSCKMNFSGFSDDFKQAISHIIQDIFPVEGGVARTKEETGFLKKLWGK